MRESLLTAEDAQRLNERVQEKIDARLFLCCNYEPTKSYALSEDGFFLAAVQDLYKFTVDTSFIIKKWFVYIRREDRWQFKGLRQALDEIDMLRAVLDHNQSPENGRIDKEYLESYQNWLRRLLEKEEPETQEDFAKLNRQLQRTASVLCRQLEVFIDYIGKSPDREATVRNWLQQIIVWYSSNTKTAIYKGYLQDAYLANAVLHGRDGGDSRHLNRKVNGWIQAKLFYPLESELDDLSHPTAMQLAFIKAQPAAAQQAIAEEIRKQKEAAEEALAVLKKRVGDKPVEYFFQQLKGQLLETFQQLEEEGSSESMLPQYFLQRDIELHFAGIPSPEGDF